MEPLHSPSDRLRVRLAEAVLEALPAITIAVAVVADVPVLAVALVVAVAPVLETSFSL
jgi:hypothetical protein